MSLPPVLLTCRPKVTSRSAAPKSTSSRNPSNSPVVVAAQSTSRSPNSLSANGTSTPAAPGVLNPEAPSPSKTTYPPAAIVVPLGMRNFSSSRRSSLKNQPPRSIAASVVFSNSMRSPGEPSVWLSTSLITTASGSGARCESASPGEPPRSLLGRQAPGEFGSAVASASSRRVSENPWPSVMPNQPSR